MQDCSLRQCQTACVVRATHIAGSGFVCVARGSIMIRELERAIRLLDSCRGLKGKLWFLAGVSGLLDSEVE